MNKILIKLIDGKEITEEDLEHALYKICDDVHASCYEACPVFEKNNCHSLGDDKDWEENRGCDCFKDGKAMLKFLRS